MPGNDDYRALGRLLDTVEEWTDEDLQSAQTLLRMQKLAMSSVHPKDERLLASMSTVAESLEQAIARAQARQ